jgi:glycosyltransferase involved in cell wall biosynthesis
MLRQVARRLPLPIKTFVRRIYRSNPLSGISLEAERAARVFDGRYVAVAGVFSAGSGLARAAELVALTLEDRGSKVLRVDLSGAIGLRVNESDARCVLPSDCRSPDITDVIIVLGPAHDPLSKFDRRWLIGRTVVAHWIWELELLPPSWSLASESYDEIWTPTGLILDVVKASLPKFHRSLRVLPYAIDKDPFPTRSPFRRQEVRRHENVPPDTFVAGYSFSVESNYYRKNPEDAVRAFFLAFPHTENVLLVLRSHDLDVRPIERAALKKTIGGDSRVRIYDSTRRLSIQDFYAMIDVYLSSSRAEGYGLHLVEAAQSGLPVITGGWRIAPEILALPGVHVVDFDIESIKDPQGNYEFIEGGKWSRPKVDKLAELLSKLYDTCAG